MTVVAVVAEVAAKERVSCTFRCRTHFQFISKIEMIGLLNDF